jgi:hypothetical protein
LLSEVVFATDDPKKPLPFMRLFEVAPLRAQPASKVAQRSPADNSRQ